MNISEVLFIAEIIASTADESINDTVDCSQSINDIEIELWEELIPADLMAVELTGSGEVFQILVINEHSYRVSSAINLRMLLFKCFDNG